MISKRSLGKSYAILAAVVIAVLVVIYGVKTLATLYTPRTTSISSEVPAPADTSSISLSEDTVLELTRALNLNELKAIQKPIILAFGSKTCPPCREMQPALKAIHETYKDKVVIKYIDVDVYPYLAQSMPIQVIPTQVLYRPGGVAYEPSETLEDQLQLLRYQHKDTQKTLYTVHQGMLSFDEFEALIKDMLLDADSVSSLS